MPFREYFSSPVNKSQTHERMKKKLNFVKNVVKFHWLGTQKMKSDKYELDKKHKDDRQEVNKKQAKIGPKTDKNLMKKAIFWLCLAMFDHFMTIS